MIILVLQLLALLLFNGILKFIFPISPTSDSTYLLHPCTLLNVGKLYLDLLIAKLKTYKL